MKKLYTLLALASSLTIGNTASAQSGGSLVLDGTPAKYAKVPHSVALNLLHGNGYTISAWVKTPGSKAGRIVSKRNGASGAGYELITSADAAPKVGINTTASTGSISGGSFTSNTLLVNTWQHVAMVVDLSPGITSNVKVFINGTLATHTSGTPASYTTNTTGTPSPTIDVNFDFMIGASYANSAAANNFKGEIDNVRFYNVAKDAAGVTEDMNAATVNGSTSNLVAAWDFNTENISGNTITDITGHGHNATSYPIITLPLDLISFKSVYNKINKNIELNWLTANEKNVKNFEILYSTNSKDFISTGTLPSKGNDQTGNNTYNYKLAFNQTAAVIYVKLKMIDNDGKFTYSDVNAVVTTPNIEISVSPNPATDVLNVNIGQNTDAKIAIIDVNGKTVSTLNTSETTATINVSALPAGTYILKVSTKTETISKKWIKK